jgi:uroporphyrinogen decarboxylase
VSKLLLDALHGKATPRRPLWIMRQAGRYLPEYRALRARHSFEELSRNAALAAEVTLQPLARFPLDAAIIFADLMSPIPATGLDVRFAPGPVVDRPVRTASDVDALRIPPREEIAPEVAAALKSVRAALAGDTALLGFAGSPWSLAAYLVQGKSAVGFPALRAMLARDPGLVRALLERLSTLVIEYITAQVAAGADAIQIFDTWAGILALADWRCAVKPHLERILRETATLGVPRILFVQDASHLVRECAALPVEAIAVDWRENLGALRSELGPRTVLQGNLDPAILLAGADATRDAASSLLARMPALGHIVNLGHGILPETPIESVNTLIDVVHGEGRQ